MALPIYPPLLPLGLHSGRTYQLVNTIQRSELQSGRAIQRRKFTSVPQGASIQWFFNSAETQLFEAWYLNTINDGEAWFSCELKTPLGLSEHTCRFTKVYKGPDLVGPDQWAISAELELRFRAVIDAAWVQFPEFILYSSIIDRAMNQEWPEA